MYLALGTRPDIAFVVNMMSRFSDKHDQSHWEAIKRVFRYLNGTIDLGIKYESSGSKSELVGFSDADFAKDTRRSTTGYAFFLSNGIVTWSSQRQRLVTLSTTESEYVAAAAAAKEAMWLRKLINDIENTNSAAVVLNVDNQSAIKLAKNPEFHKRSKHIDIRYHYLRERVADGDIDIKYTPTEVQIADIFTKPLPRDRFVALRSMLNMNSCEALKQREC